MFISQMVLEYGSIFYRGESAKLQVYASGFDVTTASVAIEAIMWPLSYNH